MILLFAAAGCGGPPAEQPPVSQVAPVSEGEPEPVTPDQGAARGEDGQGPSIVADATPPVEQPAAASEDPAPKEEPVEAEREDEAPVAEPAVLGRPEWWFAGVRRGESAVMVCAEAGGRDVRDARRAALEAARRKLGRELELDPTRERVRFAQVLPLPAADAGGGSARYIGYVMLEAEPAG